MSSDTEHPRDNSLHLWMIRAAALAGLCISGYLFYLAAQGVAPAGCGEASSCADVLASRWSKVWRFPVSAPAMVVYLVVLAASLHAGPKSPPSQRGKAWRILNLAAVAAGGSALWFIALQLFVLDAFCPFCMAAHSCSLLIAAAALLHGPRLLPLLGLAGVGALVVVQLAYRPAPDALGGIRITGLDPTNAPTLGPPDAPVVLALLYDYNCYYCLLTHQHLRDAAERYDGQLTVVLLPTAIDPACNPAVQTQAHFSRSSCAIARLALAVWVADPSKLHTFDAYLLEQIPREKVEGSVPLEVVEGAFREEAARLVGEDALAAALADPRVDHRMGESGQLYAAAAGPGGLPAGVPRIVIDGQVFGPIENPQDLFDLLETTYPDLTPANE